MTVEFEIVAYLRNSLAHRIRDGLKIIPIGQILTAGKGFRVIESDFDDSDPDDPILKITFAQKKENAFFVNKVLFQFMHNYTDDLPRFKLLKNLGESDKPSGLYSLTSDLVGIELTTGELIIDYLEDRTDEEDKFLNLNATCYVMEGIAEKDINFTIDREYIEQGDGTKASEHWYRTFLNSYEKLRKDRESGLFTKPVELENPDINKEIGIIISTRLYPVFDYIQDFFGVTDIIIEKYSETERGDLLMGKLAELIYTDLNLGGKFNKYLDSQKQQNA